MFRPLLLIVGLSACTSVELPRSPLVQKDMLAERSSIWRVGDDVFAAWWSEREPAPKARVVKVGMQGELTDVARDVPASAMGARRALGQRAGHEGARDRR